MSDNKGLENTKYKLIKNEDKLILTDKKTLKSRVLEVDDIDYVVDDNQRLRDPNVIENYFRLKDEPYEPKMMTKTADYVKEQKEAEKLYSPMKYEDLIDEFIKKYNLTTMEIKTFSQIPDETTIKKLYGRTDEDKKAMINDFKILKKKLTENKNLGTDIFSYLKSYFANYTYNTELIKLYDEISFETYIKDKSFYKNDEDYNKIKNKNIKSLQDLIDEDINDFGGITLKYLKNLIEKYDEIAAICQNEQGYFEYDSSHLNDALTDKFINDLNLMAVKTGKGGSGKKDEDSAFNNALKLYNKLDEKRKDHVDEWMKNDYDTFQKSVNEYFNLYNLDDKINGLYIAIINKNVYNRLKAKIQKEPIGTTKKTTKKTKRKTKKETKDEEINKLLDESSDEMIEKPIEEPKKEEPKKEEPKKEEPKKETKEKDDSEDEEKNSRIKGYLSIHNDIIYELYKRTDSFKKMSPLDKDEEYDTIQSFISKITNEGLKYFDANFKIQIVINVINSHQDKNLPYKISARFWGTKSKKDGLKFGNAYKEYMSGRKENTTKTYLGIPSDGILSDFYTFVLEPILQIVMRNIDMAKGLLNNKALGWTDNTLTRIEKISDTLREYSSGRINTSLLNVMKKTKMSSGWTDDTLTRIEKINNCLKDY